MNLDRAFRGLAAGISARRGAASSFGIMTGAWSFNAPKYVSSTGKADWGYKLGVAKNDFDKYNAQANQQMETRKQELTQGVLLKINTFIQEFGKKNNYKMIFGTTNEGSVLYGKDADDMTETVLKSLNEEYEKGSVSQEQKKDK